jgi:uncharacterized protein (DUF2384 family)
MDCAGAPGHSADTVDVVVRALDMPESTLVRRKKEGVLSPDESVQMVATHHCRFWIPGQAPRLY